MRPCPQGRLTCGCTPTKRSTALPSPSLITHLASFNFLAHSAVPIAALFLTFGTAGCAGGQGGAGDTEALAVTSDNLIGRWDRPSEVDGRSVPLYVDSTLEFTSSGDTLFRFWFEIEDGALVLDDRQGTTARPVVEKLTADSLVLSRLPFTNDTLRFHRTPSL